MVQGRSMTGVATIGMPLALFVLGPPAVGNMTVGAAIALRTGLRLFHNHQTIELVLPFFAFGSAAFRRLVGEFRRRIFEEVAQSDLKGLIFTYVWAFDQPQDAQFVEGLAEIFRRRGARCSPNYRPICKNVCAATKESPA